jgi:hypothetical protein
VTFKPRYERSGLVDAIKGVTCSEESILDEHQRVCLNPFHGQGRQGRSSQGSTLRGTDQGWTAHGEQHRRSGAGQGPSTS